VYGEFGGASSLEIDDSAGGSAEIRNQTNPLFDVGRDVLAGLKEIYQLRIKTDLTGKNNTLNLYLENTHSVDLI
jgi:hypothetical protein